MTLVTVLKYLVGNRQAILQVAASRGAVGVGLLFVLAAGLAREYDGADLVHEPWHLLLPLGASLVTSLVLYLLVQGLLLLRTWENPSPLSYGAFLGLYWMTAPLALLYAIPVERFLSAGDATRANLWLLGLVSLWRVLLITRALSVVYQVNFFRPLFAVMLFADSVALVLLKLTPIPVISFMGGIRLSESEDVIFSTAMMVTIVGVCTWPIWLIGALIACNKSWRLENLAAHRPPPVALHLWLAAAAVIGVWLLFLPVTQSEQQLRRQAENDLRGGRIREALLLMTGHERGDFPPHWDPPPRVGYREERPDITDVVEHFDVLPVKAWVRQIYVEKFSNWLRGESESGVWQSLDAKQAERRLAIIERLPEKNELVRNHEYELRVMLRVWRSPLRERVEKLLTDAGISFDRPERPGESAGPALVPPAEQPPAHD